MTATITMCTDLAPVQSMARSIGIVGVAGLIANAVGPSLGEEIIRRAGFAGLFNSSLVFLLLSFLLVSLTRGCQKKTGSPAGLHPSLVFWVRPRWSCCSS